MSDAPPSGKRGSTAAPLTAAMTRRMLEHALEAFLVVDRSGVVRYANTEGTRLLRRLGGRARAGVWRLDGLSASASQTLRRSVERALAGRPARAESEILTGREGRWVAVRAAAMGEGRAARVLVTARDVSDRKNLEVLQLAAESRERESEELYRLLAENSTDMISRHRPDGVYTYASPACTTLLGWSPQELVGRPVYELYHPDDLEAVRASHSTVTERPVAYTVTYRIRRKDGSYTWFETTNRQIVGPEGLREIIADSRDISARKAVEEERDRLFTYSVDLLTVVGYAGHIKQVNPAWTQTLGWSETELLERPWMELVHPEDIPAAEAIHTELEKERSIFTLENRVRRKDGSYLWMSWNAFSIRAEQLIFSVGRDVTARKEMEERLRLLADHDGLTGAYNRRTWHELSEKELARSRRHSFPLSVLMVDLDHFKSINDRWGHAAGDEVLKTIPRIFETVLRGHDIVGRIGGEEFAVTLAQCDLATATRIADRLRSEAENTPVNAPTATVRFTLSVGVTSLVDDESLTVLMERADNALYRAKHGGRNRVVEWSARSGG